MFQPNDDPIVILPLFKKTASTDWFENSEMQFQLRNGMCTTTRFYNVIITLPLDIVSNLSLKVQRGTDYDVLKAELLSTFKQTKPEQFQVQRETDYDVLKAELLSTFKQTKPEQFKEKEPFKINLNLMNVNKIEKRQPPEESNKIKQHQTQNLLKHQKQKHQYQAQQQHKKQDQRQPHRNQQPNTPEKGGE
ncbi:hypothetical protein HELRODRAFT_169149 [Helobdella robusta]|uniref:DUF7041 domain-containing protein n=1 Tax=Helobdella robusta TaxID=6412 RepID=T1F1H1_HELRO|nr:hypothetical protein HELRODRAFT_169149 [Helobdella robusta]ESO08338.1 hypothetical protein HELRODRAFT_169149 [Helobdella robusta]